MTPEQWRAIDRMVLPVVATGLVVRIGLDMLESPARRLGFAGPVIGAAIVLLLWGVSKVVRRARQP